MKPQIEKLVGRLQKVISSQGIEARLDAYDEDSAPDLWKRSTCEVLEDIRDRKQSIRIRVYHSRSNPVLLPIVLAHEVGHVMSEDIKAGSYNKRYLHNPIPFEIKASAWALHWFRKQGFSREDLKGVKAVYAGCLQGYKEAYQLVEK